MFNNIHEMQDNFENYIFKHKSLDPKILILYKISKHNEFQVFPSQTNDRKCSDIHNKLIKNSNTFLMKK